MIVDKMNNISFYKGLLPNLENGLKAIETMGKPELGRYEFDGGYFMVQKGTTNPLENGNFEVHRKYIDVQIILEGSEEMAWNNLGDLTPAIAYNPENDAEFLSGKFDHVMEITAGMFYAVFPEDGHKPGSHTGTPHDYLKIVMKLPVA